MPNARPGKPSANLERNAKNPGPSRMLQPNARKYTWKLGTMDGRAPRGLATSRNGKKEKAMKVIKTPAVDAALRTLAADDRQRVFSWFDHLANWENDEQVRKMAK